MTDSSAPAEQSPDSSATEPAERISYWTIVWRQLQKNAIAVFGLYCIAALVLLAVLAPLISHNQPVLWNAGDGWESPLFANLFNRLLFENGVDVFFNLMLVLSPLYVGAYRLARRHYGSDFARARPRVVGALVLFHVVVLTAMTPRTLAGADNPFYSTEKVENYRTKRVELEAQGKHVTAIFPLRTFSYRETDPTRSVSAPSGEHWLGTDAEGRDVFARMLYGTRISLTIGVVAVALYVAIGVIFGALAGYFGGWVDSTISRFIEVMICFPSFFLILTLAALIEQRSIFHVMVIIGLTSWTGVARLIRAEFLKHKTLEYADAALALGIPKRRIIFGHILPNAIAPVLVTATFGIASAILVESSLAFLGLGDLSVASWGETLNTGRTEQKLWLILAPGFAIFFVVSVFNLVGEGLRDALDPKLRS